MSAHLSAVPSLHSCEHGLTIRSGARGSPRRSARASVHTAHLRIPHLHSRISAYRACVHALVDSAGTLHMQASRAPQLASWYRCLSAHTLVHAFARTATPQVSACLDGRLRSLRRHQYPQRIPSYTRRQPGTNRHIPWRSKSRRSHPASPVRAYGQLCQQSRACARHSEIRGHKTCVCTLRFVVSTPHSVRLTRMSTSGQANCEPLWQTARVLQRCVPTCACMCVFSPCSGVKMAS